MLLKAVRFRAKHVLRVRGNEADAVQYGGRDGRPREAGEAARFCATDEWATVAEEEERRIWMYKCAIEIRRRVTQPRGACEARRRRQRTGHGVAVEERNHYRHSRGHVGTRREYKLVRLR